MTVPFVPQPTRPNHASAGIHAPWRVILAGILLVLSLLVSACGHKPVLLPTATETSVPSLTPSATSTPSPVPTSTSTPQPAWFEQIHPGYAESRYRHGLVNDPRARIYVSIEDAVTSSGNFGTLPNAPAYIVIGGEETREGQTYYATLLGWISAAEVELVTPSSLRGILLTREVDFRFAWVLETVQSVNAVGTPIRTYSRYDLVHEVPPTTENPGYFATGPDEWLPLKSLAVTSGALPLDVDAGACRFMYVDLSAQTLRIYDDCKLVFATLVSTGKEPAWTAPDRYHILYKVESTQLTPPDGSLSVYFLQGVPYFMSYAGDWGFHGAYWHDDFGKPVSHGCVNLSPADAKWVYEWATEGEVVFIVRGVTP